MSASTTCKLPPELLLQILDSLAPPPATIAIPLSDPAAKTIHAFASVCRLTYPTAVRYLYSHCLHIDSQARLRLLLISLDALLSPKRPDETSLPYVAIKPLLTCLFLAPFPPHTFDDQPIAQWLFELLAVMQPSLKRLVIDVPFHTVPPHRDDLNVNRRLNDAFSQLTNVEDFVSCNISPIYWTEWPKLKRLALSDMMLEELYPQFDEPKDLQNLHCMVLANAFPFAPSSKRAFLENMVYRRTKLVLLHENNGYRSSWKETVRWMSMGMGQLSTDESRGHRNECIERFCLPRDDKTRKLWMRERALEGRIWDVEMEPEPVEPEPATWCTHQTIWQD